MNALEDEFLAIELKLRAIYEKMPNVSPPLPGIRAIPRWMFDGVRLSFDEDIDKLAPHRREAGRIFLARSIAEHDVELEAAGVKALDDRQDAIGILLGPVVDRMIAAPVRTIADVAALVDVTLGEAELETDPGDGASPSALRRRASPSCARR